MLFSLSVGRPCDGPARLLLSKRHAVQWMSDGILKAVVRRCPARLRAVALTKYKLVINLKSAKALGIPAPQTDSRADEVHPLC